MENLLSELELMKLMGFDVADLAANRLGQLTQKQKTLLAEKATKHKSLYTIIGIVIAIMVCGGRRYGWVCPC